jgi:hypothetical protein
MVQVAIATLRPDMMSPGSHDAFVIEDADYLLQPRTDGNADLLALRLCAGDAVQAQCVINSAINTDQRSVSTAEVYHAWRAASAKRGVDPGVSSTTQNPCQL